MTPRDDSRPMIGWVSHRCCHRHDTLKSLGNEPVGSFLRCSRPLCSSQHTASTPTPLSTAECGRGLKKPLAPHRSAGLLSGPSGPNSVHVPDILIESVPFFRRRRTETQSIELIPMSMFHPELPAEDVCFGSGAWKTVVSSCSLERR